MRKDRVIRLGLFSLGAVLAIGSHGQTTERIGIDGSTGGMPLAAALGKAFQEHNPGVKIQMGKGLGTKARLQALAEGKIDIALASHGPGLTAKWIVGSCETTSRA
jgi:phosphate transport system substrate-binding protein